MNKVDAGKVIIASIIGAVNSVVGVMSGFLGILALPVLLLVISSVVDYLTGVIASVYRGQEISSYKGIRGIVKKLAMWLLIAVGVITDEVIVYSVEQFGLEIPITFVVASIVAIWLVLNELISILENLKDIGVPLPPFVQKLLKYIKSQVENKADIVPDDEETEES